MAQERRDAFNAAAREEMGREQQARFRELNAQRREREEAEAAAKKRRQDAKQAAEEAKAKAQEELMAQEKAKQEARWASANARTADERAKTCLHSGHCGKIQQRQKLKCGACHARRGITAFECPHCQLLICQQCVGHFAKKRAAADKPRPPPPSSKPERPKPAADTPSQKAEDEGKAEAGLKTEAAQSQSHKNGGGNRKGPVDGQQQPKKKWKKTCFKCHKEGHIAHDCWQKAANANGNGGAGKPGPKSNGNKKNGGK